MLRRKSDTIWAMSQQIIQPFKVSFSAKEINEFLDRAREILAVGMLIPGKNNIELENIFAKFVGVKYAVAVSSGAAALEIIYRCLNLSNSEILVPANTNYATVETTIRANANPVLYDSDLFPDFESINKTISKKTKALVIAHIGGYITPQIDKLELFCRKNKIYLIEDASHAHGSRYGNKSAGSFGIASAFSMFATKVITTSEGGVILTNKQQIRDFALTCRDQGKDKEGTKNVLFGSSWRMSELHAALGIVQMKHISSYLKRNNEIINHYKTNIKQDRISIPPDENTYYSGYKFIIHLPNNKDKESLKTYLLKNNIKPAKGVYDIPIHLQPVFSELNRDKYPRAEHFAKTHVCLPIWKGMKEKEVERVVEIVNKWSTT